MESDHLGNVHLWGIARRRSPVAGEIHDYWGILGKAKMWCKEKDGFSPSFLSWRAKNNDRRNIFAIIWQLFRQMAGGRSGAGRAGDGAGDCLWQINVLKSLLEAVQGATVSVLSCAPVLMGMFAG